MATWDFGGGCPCGVMKECNCGHVEEEKNRLNNLKHYSSLSLRHVLDVSLSHFNGTSAYKETLGSALCRACGIDDKLIIRDENDKHALLKFIENYVKG